MTGEIPQSNALSEASPDSLSELFSRDPEHYGDQDIDRVIAEMRTQRTRHELAEAAGKPIRNTKAKSPTSNTKLTTNHSADDMGL